jgi:hypothetical protein
MGEVPGCNADKRIKRASEENVNQILSKRHSQNNVS